MSTNLQNASDEEAMEAAYGTYENALIDADLTRDEAVANLDYSTSVSSSNIQKTLVLAMALAVKDKDIRLNNALATLQVTQRAYDLWNLDHKQVAKFNRESSKAAAARDYAKAVENARHTRDDAIEAAKRDQDIAQAQAQSNYHVSVASARAAAYSRWAAADGGNWANYQSQLAQNYLSFVVTVEPASVTHTITEANATYTKLSGVSNALRNHSNFVSDAEYNRVLDRITVIKNFILASNVGKIANLSEVSHIETKVRRNANASATYNYDVTMASLNQSKAQNDASDRLTFNLEAARADAQRRRDELAGSSGASAAYDARMEAAQAQLRQDLHDNSEVFLTGQKAADRTKRDEVLNAVKVFKDGVISGEKRWVDDVAKNATDLEIGIAAAVGTYTYTTAVNSADTQVIIAGINATWIGTLSGGDVTYNNASANATKTYVDANVADKRDFQNADAQDWYDAVAAWNASEGTLWTAFRLDLADAQKDRIAALGSAEVAYVGAISSSDVAWMATAGAAQDAYDQLQAAQLVSATTSTAATSNAAALVAKNALITQAASISNARKLYELSVWALAKTLADMETNEKKARDTAFSEAKSVYRHEAWRNGSLFSMGLLSSSEYNLAMEAARDTRATAEANAEVAYVNALAVARKDFTGDATSGEAKSQRDLIAALGAANVTFATSVEGAILDSATGAANAEQARLEAVADGYITLMSAIGGADETRTKAHSAAEKTYSIAGATAEADHDVAVVTAQVDYDVATTAQHAIVVAAWAGTEGTHHATFLAGLAAANRDRVAAEAGARLSYASSTAAADVALATTIASAEKDYIDAEALANKTFEASHESASQAAAKAVGSATKQSAIDIAVAAKTKSLSEIEAERTYNNKLAEATLVYEGAVAAANVTWVSAMANAKKARHIADYTFFAELAYEAAQDAAASTKRVFGDKGFSSLATIRIPAYEGREELDEAVRPRDFVCFAVSTR